MCFLAIFCNIIVISKNTLYVTIFTMTILRLSAQHIRPKHRAYSKKLRVGVAHNYVLV